MFDAYLTLVMATFLLLGSPGPAPLALAATGATFGIREGTPFLGGILLGLAVAIFAATLGMATLFSLYPQGKIICQVIGAIYILYIAFKVATAPVGANASASSAPRFFDGFILNLVNPKVYAVFLAIYAQFLLPYSNEIWAHVMTGIVCFLVAVVVDCLWLALGGGLKVLFNHNVYARVIRIFMAALMVLAVLLTIGY